MTHALAPTFQREIGSLYLRHLLYFSNRLAVGMKGGSFFRL